MKRVFIDCRLLFSSGIGTYVRNVLPKVAEICAKGGSLEWVMLCKTSDQAACKSLLSCSDNVLTVACDAGIYGVREQWALLNAAEKADVVWSPHYNIPVLWPGKLMVTVHDTFHLSMPQFVHGMHRQAYAKLMFRWLASKATRIICVSQFTAAELAKHVRVEPQRLRVIPNGVAPAWFSHEGDAPYTRRPYFLYVGNVKPHKNLVRLLEAYASIEKQVPHDLIIIGKKEGFITEDVAVVKSAEAFGERVVFAGEVGDQQLKDYVKHAEALVFPSLYEGFGLPPLEAMAAECPALVSNVASLPEVCGEGALYCDPLSSRDIADKMLALVQDDALRSKLKVLGRARARQFTWERAAMHTATVLQEAISA